MMITMSNSTDLSLSEINGLIQSSRALEFISVSKDERNKWVQEVLMNYQYLHASKPVKSLLKKYVRKMTGLSRAQATRLIKHYRAYGALNKVNDYHRHKFVKIYNPDDLALLAKVDNAHNCLSGPATLTIIEREYQLFGKTEYANLANISVSHLYRLRNTDRYREKVKIFSKTKAVKTPIGERRKPEPNGEPGHLVVDTVHQGDKDKEKGIYHINIVDLTTQYEFIGSVPVISERFMEKMLNDLLNLFPFKIIEFHSDNGSEYINEIVARLLNKLLIRFTKSRPRHTNDNALVESKNGAIIRKHIGYINIGKNKANVVNDFYLKTFNNYLNYHRPCAFPEIKVLPRGKEIKTYPKENYQTPYEKLKSIPEAEEKHLKQGITFQDLDKIAYQISDTDYAEMLQKEKYQMLKKIFNR